MSDKQSNLKLSSIIAAIGLLLFLLVMFFPEYLRPNSVVWKNATEQQSKGTHLASSTENLALNNPTRYAFITDELAPQLGVFDTYVNKIIKIIPLAAKAHLISLSKEGSTLIYTEKGAKYFYTVDLKTLAQEKIKTTIPIISLMIDSSGRWVAFSDKNSSQLLDKKNNKITKISTLGRVEFIFLQRNKTLIINELDHGKIREISLKNYHSKQLFDLKKPISSISIMPNLLALFFTSNSELYRYALLDGTLTSYPFSTTNERPYISSESRTVFAIATEESQKKLLEINAYTMKIKNQFLINKLSSSKNKIMTGWLEQTAIVSEKNALAAINLKSIHTHRTKVKSEFNDMLVQADSKILLATLKGKSDLLIFDIKKEKIIDSIPTKLQQPGQLLMGQTNTVCH